MTKYLHHTCYFAWNNEINDNQENQALDEFDELF
jgi:hypothetical protein